MGEGDKRTEKTEEDVAKEIAAARSAWKASHGDPKPGEAGPFPFDSEVVVRRYAFGVRQHLVVTFVDAGRRRRSRCPLRNAGTASRSSEPSKVASAQLDPDREVLLDLDKFDDGRTRESDGTASARWALEVSNALQLVLSLLVTQ